MTESLEESLKRLNTTYIDLYLWHMMSVTDFDICFTKEAWDWVDKMKSDGKIRLVWIGSRSTLKYLAEIRPVLEGIGSRFDNVVLRIICDDFLDLEKMPVEKHPWSIESETTDLGACDIGLAPLPDNRFTRGKCGFKILQYGAAGLPVIASPVGANAEYVRHGTVGFLATNEAQWVESISTLAGRPDLIKSMGLAAREMAANFDIAVVGKRLCDAVKSCINSDFPSKP